MNANQLSKFILGHFFLFPNLFELFSQQLLYGSIVMGMFLTSMIKNLTAIGPKVIVALSVASLIAILIMLFANSPAIGIVAVILAGLAFAPIFSTIVGVTFSKFEPGLYGSIFGIFFSVGLLGGTLIPNIVGNLSVGSTVQHSLLIPAIMAGILIVVALFIGNVGARKAK